MYTYCSLGLILFAFSKDEVFDELMTKLRFEAIQITIFLSALFVLFVMMIGDSLKVGAISFMQWQMVMFLIIYSIGCQNRWPRPIMNNHIKVECARHDLSQSDLAEKVGVTRQTIYAIEKKKFIPSTVLAFKIASVLKIDVDELFELEEADWD